MRRRITEGTSFAQLVEDILQLACPRDDRADAQDVQFKKQTESREVSVEERVFIVPLGLNSDTASKVIDVMSRSQRHSVVRANLDLEAVFFPKSIVEKPIDSTGNRRFATARCQDVRTLQGEF